MDDAAVVRLLGPLEVEQPRGVPAPVGGPKERAVLAVLAVNVGRPVDELTLIDALWADAPPRTAVKTVQTYVARLRRSLRGAIVARPGGYVLAADVDLDQVIRLAARSPGSRDANAALCTAVHLFRGTPMIDVAETAWTIAQRRRIEEVRLTLTEDWLDTELAAGRHTAAIPELEAMVLEAPLRERRWAQLMLALYRAGRQAEALRAFQRVRVMLIDEVGLEPSRELRMLEGRMLAQDSALLTRTGRVGDLAPPVADGDRPAPPNHNRTHTRWCRRSRPHQSDRHTGSA